VQAQPLNRSDALRALLLRALDEAEAEDELSAKPKAKKGKSK